MNLRVPIAEQPVTNVRLVSEKELDKVIFGSLQIKTFICDAEDLPNQDDEINTFLKQKPIYIISCHSIEHTGKIITRYAYREIEIPRLQPNPMSENKIKGIFG